MTTDKFLKKLGRRVARERQAKGFSQDDVAAEGDISRSTMDRIERGATDPRASTLQKIADVIGVPVKKFFEDRD